MIVWLVSYPRSGNTFFRVLLHSAFQLRSYSLHRDENDIGADDRISNVVGHETLPEGFDVHKARSDSKLYVIKTHALPQELDGLEKDRVIYLLRDGRDSSLSYMHYQQNFFGNEMDLLDVIIGDVPFGSWSDHVQAWDPSRRPNTLFLRFEKLVAHPETYIENIAEFLQVENVAHHIPDFTELHNISPKFFRKGKTQAWKSSYTKEESLVFWLLHGEQMLRYGYEEGIPSCFQAESGKMSEDLSILGRTQRKAIHRLLARKQEYRRIIDMASQEDPVALRQWAESLESALQEQKELSDKLRRWAESSDAYLAEERKLSQSYRQWAEHSDSLLQEEKKIAEGYLQWAQRSDAAWAAERERGQQMQEWAEHLEDSLLQEKELSHRQRRILHSRKQLFVRLIKMCLGMDVSRD